MMCRNHLAQHEAHILGAQSMLIRESIRWPLQSGQEGTGDKESSVKQPGVLKKTGCVLEPGSCRFKS